MEVTSLCVGGIVRRPKAIEWRGGHVRSSIGRWEGGVHAGAVTETNSFHDQVS